MVRYLSMLIAAIAAFTLTAPPATAQTAGVIDWSTLGFADEAAIPSGTVVNSAGVDTTLTWSVTTDGGSFVAFGGNDFVSYESNTENGVTGFAQLGFDNDSQDPDDRVTVDFAFSEAITNLQFTITDVDQSAWDDFVEVFYDTGSGFINAKTGAFETLGGGAVFRDNETFGDGWEGGASAASTSTIGNIDFDFNVERITAIRIIYFSSNDGSSANPGGQRAGISDIAYQTVVPTADLRLSKTVNDQFPTFGDTVTFTVTVTNDGPDDATGVAVSDRLPSGLTYVSDNGGGAYVSASGVWTIGALAAGASTSLQISASVNAAGAYANLAEVFASDQADPDSTPGNSAAAPGEDDTGVVTLSPGGAPGVPPTLSCAGSSLSHDWDANSWTAGALNQSYTSSGEPLDFQFSGDTNRLLATFAGGGNPVTSNLLTGGLFPAQNALLYVANYASDAETITLDIDIGAAGVGVSELQFSIFDVDNNTGGAGFVDQLQISGSLNGVFVAPTLTNGASNTTSGVTATGIAASASANADGNVVVTFTQTVDRVTIVYGNGAGAPANPGQQGVAVHDLAWCPPASATLDAIKTARAIASDGVDATTCASLPTPGANSAYALPGACMQYDIAVSHVGGTAAAADINLADLLPSTLTFASASHTGFSGGAIRTTDNAATPATIACDATTPACVVRLEGAALMPGATGVLTIRALVE